MASITEISEKRRYNAAPDARSTQRDACFDCSICLEPAVEPVVTLCGHLYCWPCIYKWMRVDIKSASAPHCPVCRTPVSEDALIALYACGGLESDGGRSLGVPSRPSVVRQEEEPRRHDDDYCASVLCSTGGEVLLGLAVAVNTPVSRPYRYRLETYDGSGFKERRQVQVVEEALHQIWIFLFSCAVFCLLFF